MPSKRKEGDIVVIFDNEELFLDLVRYSGMEVRIGKPKRWAEKLELPPTYYDDRKVKDWKPS
jgi:hypothetical protein